MKIKSQIIVLIAGAVLTPVLLISTVSIYSINKRTNAEIEQFRQDEMTKLKLYLKHMVDIAYGMVESNYKNAPAADFLSQPDTSQLSINTEAMPLSLPEPIETQATHMQKCLTHLAAIRFDRGEGYFWITDNQVPYPTMVMHAEKPELDGKILDDPKFNVAKETKENIYQLRAKLCNTSGEGYTEYIMKKPGSTEVDNKISYSRTFAPLGWIISTGLYTDQIEDAVNRKKEQLQQQLNQIIVIVGISSLLVLSGGIFVAFYFGNQLVQAIHQLNDRLKQLAIGKQVSQVTDSRKDEIGEMAASLNALAAGVGTYASFAREIGQGNLDQPFQPLSAEDELGNELLEMRGSLKKAAQEKAIRDWTNEGITLFSDMLRKHNTDTQQLGLEVIRGLVKYMHINQGAIFLHREESGENHLERIATYAYNRTKYLSQKIAFGQGLVGQCALEKATVHLREIPTNYLQITSGLGEAPPRTLLIVPLLHNESLIGVLEMASFQHFQDHEIAFVERVAESIASSVAAITVNEHTKQLLSESQRMAEELRAQEEELRQNQEEMEASQEEMRRQQEALQQEVIMLRNRQQGDTLVS